MPLHRHTSKRKMARQTLVEATGSPFAPGSETRAVVAVMDGRKTNDDLEPREWTQALAAAGGDVAVYFEVPADHEWWVAYDATMDAWHRWTTYPSGGWDHTEVPREVLEFSIEEIEGHTHDIYRSRVVRVEDSPEFVRQRITGAGGERR